MKLNRIQQTIYEEYQRVGKVWADCPRGCGKTTLLIKIIVEELLKDKRVSLSTLNPKIFEQIKQKIWKILQSTDSKTAETRIDNLIEGEVWFEDDAVFSELKSDVSINDEVYYDLYKKKQNHEKILCLRTRPHKLFNFTYTDLDTDSKEEIEKLKKQLSSEQFDLTFNSPIERVKQENEQTHTQEQMPKM